MYLPSHDSCYAHTVQLVVKDGLKEADTIKAVIAKASSIVGWVRRSTINTEMLEECRKLQASNTTRWNPELTMIQSLLRIPHEKIDELNKAHKLSHYEWIILTELCDLLTTFGTATDYTQGDKVVTASLVIASIRGLKAQLLNVSVQYTEPVRAALLNSIDRRLSTYEDKNSFQMAAILDPRFNLTWCHSKQESSKLKNCLMTAVDVINPSSAVPASSPESPPRKRCKLFSFMAAAATQATLPTDIACKEEVEFTYPSHAFQMTPTQWSSGKQDVILILHWQNWLRSILLFQLHQHQWRGYSVRLARYFAGQIQRFSTQ